MKWSFSSQVSQLNLQNKKFDFLNWSRDINMQFPEKSCDFCIYSKTSCNIHDNHVIAKMRKNAQKVEENPSFAYS